MSLPSADDVQVMNEMARIITNGGTVHVDRIEIESAKHAPTLLREAGITEALLALLIPDLKAIADAEEACLEDARRTGQPPKGCKARVTFTSICILASSIFGGSEGPPMFDPFSNPRVPDNLGARNRG